MIMRLWVQLHDITVSYNYLGQVVCTHVHLSPRSIIWSSQRAVSLGMAINPQILCMGYSDIVILLNLYALYKKLVCMYVCMYAPVGR